MATHDYDLANQSGASFRSDLNNVLQAILTNNSSASAPSTTAAYMFWADTNTGILKIRNSANSAWVELLQLDGTLTLEDGSVSAVALGFRDELNTGIFSSGASNFDVAIAGTTRLNISATGLNVTGTVTDDGATHDGDVTFTGAAANVVFDKSDNALEFADNAKATFGDGADLTISHNGSNSIINDNGTGELLLQRAGNTILSLNSTGIEITDPSGAAELTITGFEANNAHIVLQADEGDDNADKWRIRNVAATNNFQIQNFTSGSYVSMLTCKADGSVGIGDTDPDQKLCVEGSGTTILKVQNTDDGTAQITLGNTGSSNFNLKLINAETIFDVGGNEKMRLTSAGALCIGTTTADASGAKLTVESTSSESICHMEKPSTGNKTILNLQHGRAVGSTTGNVLICRNSIGTNVGSIKSAVDSTTFNTTSDYRLKENAVAISDGITRLKTLKPYRFNFKASPSKTVDGFFAHEVTAVPEAITGTKDAVVTQAMIDTGEYEEGTLNDPIYQGIDQSKLVPLLVAAVQELITKVETLEAA